MSAVEGVAVERQAAPRPLWVSLVVGAAASVLFLFPGWVGGGRLPLQNLWHVRTMPDDMPFALLPVSQYEALSIFVMLLLGGVVAGLVVRMLGVRAWPAALAVLAVHIVVTVQSFAVVAAGHGIFDGSAGSRELLYVGGMLGGVVAGMLLAQLGCWMASRPTVALPALAVVLAAVPAGSWISYAIASFNPIYGVPTGLLPVLRWVPAVIVAAALIWCGVRPLARLVVWVVGLLALWVLPAVFTSIGYALGMRVLDGDLREMAQAAVQIFPAVLAEVTLPAIVAVVLAVTGAVLVRVWSRRTEASERQRSTPIPYP